MLFIAFVQPFIDGLLAVILSYFELLKSKIAVEIGNNKYDEESQNDEANSIGFHVPDQEEEEDEDDE